MKNAIMEMKLLTYISRTLSVLATIFTILSFYGYSSNKKSFYILYIRDNISCMYNIYFYKQKEYIKKDIGFYP